MKRVVFLIFSLIICLFLSSCKGGTERIFDYQENIRAVKGTYTSGEEKRSAVLYFEKAEDGNRCRRIEYSYPESLEGISYTLEGDKITAELDGIRIAYSYFEEKKVFLLARFFALCEEDIYDIKTGENKTTVAFGKNEVCRFEAVTSKDGTPVRIVYEDTDFAGTFTVESVEYFSDD